MTSLSKVNAGAVCAVCGAPATWESADPESPPQHFLCDRHRKSWIRFNNGIPRGARTNPTRWEEIFDQFLWEYEVTRGSS